MWCWAAGQQRWGKPPAKPTSDPLWTVMSYARAAAAPVTRADIGPAWWIVAGCVPLDAGYAQPVVVAGAGMAAIKRVTNTRTMNRIISSVFKIFLLSHHFNKFLLP